MSANVEGIIREAIRAYRAGNKPEARQLLEKATELDAYNEQAWMWLSAVVDTPEDQRVCLENVLIINPNNENAKRGLSMLGTASAPPQEAPPKQEYSIPPTATSSASTIYTPANEVSENEYDDWVAGLNLGGGSSSATPSNSETAFESAFADAFDDDDFEDAAFDGGDHDDMHDLRQFALSQSEDTLDIDDPDSLFDDDDFLPGDGPFSSQSIGFDMDLPEETASRPPTAPRRSPMEPSVRQSPIQRSSSSTAFVDTAEFNAVSDADPGEYFRAIPKGVRPTRLPGTQESYSPVLLIGLVLLVLLNVGAFVALITNLGT